MTDTTPVAKRLKEARTRAELSQKELGIQAGIDEFSASARINQYEKGKHTPDYRTMERLAEVLGVPVPFFYTRDNTLADLILAWVPSRPPIVDSSRSALRNSRSTLESQFGENGFVCLEVARFTGREKGSK